MPSTDPPPPGGAARAESWGLAAKINHLFDTVRRPDGTRYTNEEVAAALSAEGAGGRISGTYLWYLRRGERDNPTKRHLEALASFFDVSPAYFFDDDKSKAIASELAVLRALKDADVQHVATRLSGLSSNSLKAVAQVIDQIRQLEGLGAGGAQEPS